MTLLKPLSIQRIRDNALKPELDYIDSIIKFQDFHYQQNGEIVVLIDRDFPNYNLLTVERLSAIIKLYEALGWRILQKEVEDKTERLLVFS